MPISEEHLSALLEKSSFSALIEEAEKSTLAHPEAAIGWKALGLGLYYQADFNKAAQALRKASFLLTNDAAVFKTLALIAKQQQQLPRALAYFEYVIKLAPNDLEALNFAGLMYLELEEPSQAVNCFSQLANLQPNQFNNQINLAKAYKANNELNKFRLALIQAQKIPPTTEEEWATLANQWIDSDYTKEGTSALLNLIKINPNNKNIPYLQGIVAAKSGKNEEAIQLFKQSLSVFPNQPKAAINASLLMFGKNPTAAIDILKTSHLHNPKNFDLLNHLCTAVFLIEDYKDVGIYINKLAEIKLNATTYDFIGKYNYAREDYEQAVIAFEKSLEIKPNQKHFINSYVDALSKNGNSSKAIAVIESHPSLQDELAVIFSNILHNKGDNEEAIKKVKQAINSKHCQHNTPGVFSNYLYISIYSNKINNKNLFKEHLKYEKKYAAKINAFKNHTNLADPNKKINIGFVSGDMHNHAVAYFAKPIFKNLDKQAFELSVFYNHDLEDQETNTLKSLVNHWFDVVKMSDLELADFIKSKGVDILIDLSGHTGRNRLITFAYKPAPIQITAIGYGYTTGLKAMDYTFTSSLTNDIANQEKYWTEKFIIFPHQRLDVRPQRRQEAPEPVQQLPAYTNGYFTYGSLNRFNKISKETLNTWVTILQLNPTSKLLLGNVEEHQAAEIIDFFAQGEIAAERLILKPRTQLKNYMGLFNEIDLILDTWPFGGGTTTNDALSMGVTVLALQGEHPIQAVHNTVLASMKLERFLTDGITSYISEAVAWATRLEELQAIRTDLLNRPELTAAAVEDATPSYLNWNKGLRMAWQRWCAGLPVESFTVDS